MKSFPNISFNFETSITEGVAPGLTSVCSYPLKKGSFTNPIYTRTWAVEYHSKKAGRMRLKSDGKWRSREPGTIHIYAPGCVYWEDTRKADLPIQETYIFFNSAQFCPLEKIIDSELLFAKLHDPGNIIGSLILKAAELCEEFGNNAYWDTQALLMEMIHFLINAEKDSEGKLYIKRKYSKRALSFSSEVENYLRRNLERNIKIADIASYMKVSESSLNHKFKEETGVSPIAKFIEMKMEFVKSLLLKGEKLKVIAEMTGFYDEYYLSKTFKKTTGLSPREFKQKSQLNK